MKLKDILNMESYLKNDCYYPGEIYSSDGFFYELFAPEDECAKLAENEDFVAVICKTQILVLWKDNNQIVDSARYDATENNMKNVKTIAAGHKPTEYMDKFATNTEDSTLEGILAIADAIMID